MDNPDPAEEPNLNTGNPWSSWDDQDIRWGLDHNSSIEEIANFLCRTPSKVRRRIEQIGEADAIGDPSLLQDGLTDRDRIALETYRDARAAMALIREAVEDCAPPGSVTREGYLTPEFTVQAEALVRGIYAIANRRPSKRQTASCPPKTEAKMRVIIPTLVGLVALAATSVQAAPVPTKMHHHPKWHETPAQNVRKSQQYDYLVASNSRFRANRMRKECGPIRDAGLRASCVGSFNEYEPR